MSVEHRLHARCGCAASHAEEALGGARPFAFASSPRVFERDRPFLVDHLALDLTLDVAKKSVSGSASLEIERVDPEAEEIALDAVGFDVRAVKVGEKATPFAYDGKVLRVTIRRDVAAARVTVEYAATPRRGMYFLEPDEHVPARPRQVWTQCQEEDARHFFPCHDKPHVKMTTELEAKVPNGWTVLSNGELVKKETPEKGAWRFHWKMNEPHPSYLFTLVAGEFAELRDEAGKVPLSYLVPKGREDDGRRTFGRTPQMIEHFAKLTGVDYPWNKYAQVVVSDFIFGGMENTTATTMYEHILLDARAAIDVSSDDLIAHELAHQWFGDYVTCRDWSEGWLNEGFATYFEHVWREHHLGRDEYEWGLKVDLAAYLAEASGRYRRPVVCQDYDAPLDLFDRHLYEKGGLVLHQIRTELGDKLFWRGVNLYLTRHAKSVVETRDLMRAFEEVSGRSLGKLVEQGIHRPGHPELEVEVSWAKEVLTVAVKQTHAATDGVPSVFEMPLFVDVADELGAVRRVRLAIAHRNESFAIPCKARPKYAVVDPEMRVLGDVQVRAPGDMLRAQLATGKSARARWLAAQSLAKSDDPTVIAALAGRLDDEKEAWMVRAECADALGKIRARESFDALVRARSVKHPKARRAVMDALGNFKTTAALDALKPCALKDESYLVEAEAARALGRTKQGGALDVLVELLERASWADVIRAAALDGMAALRDDRALAHVQARTRYGHPTRARRSAILALPKIASDRKARELLEDLLEDHDPHLRIDVVRALLDLGDARARGAMRARLDVDLDARVRRRLREGLRELGGEGKRAHEQLREELEKVQNLHGELKARLAALEARIDGGEGGGGKRGKAAPKAAAKAKAKKRR
jgi:aminopeptidase N